MKEQARVTVISTICNAEDDITTTKYQYDGATLERKGSTVRVKYTVRGDEAHYDSDIIATEGEQCRVRVVRTGDIRSEMLFIEGHEHSFDYFIGGLTAQASVLTESIRITASDRSCQIRIRYKFVMNSFPSDNEIIYNVNV